VAAGYFAISIAARNLFQLSGIDAKLRSNAGGFD
jgi:hypothetical protein